MDTISYISNNIAMTVSIVSFMFTLWHYKAFKWLAIIPAMFAISTISYDMLGTSTVSNVLYDITTVLAIGTILAKNAICK